MLRLVAQARRKLPDAVRKTAGRPRFAHVLPLRARVHLSILVWLEEANPGAAASVSMSGAAGESPSGIRSSAREFHEEATLSSEEQDDLTRRRFLTLGAGVAGLVAGSRAEDLGAVGRRPRIEERLAAPTDAAAPKPAPLGGAPVARARADDPGSGIQRRGSPGATERASPTQQAAEVQDLIEEAAAKGREFCVLPEGLLPYDANAVEFDDSIRMLRSGQQIDTYDIQAYGAAVDGSTDDHAAVSAAEHAAKANGGELLVAGGPAWIAGDITISVPLRFLRGGEIAPASDVLVSIEAPVLAGGYGIFGGRGVVRVDYTTEPINILWFPGESLDAKWDNMREGFQSNVRKHVTIPNPGPTSNPWSVELDGASNIAAWRLDGPLTFDGDTESHMTLEVHGILQAEREMERMIHVSPTNKLENLNIITELFLNGRRRADWLIDIRALSRGSFGGMWHLRGLSATGGGARIEAANGTISETTFPHIDVTSLAGTGVRIDGMERGVAGVEIEMIYAQNGVAPTDRVLDIAGTVRELGVRKVVYRDPHGQRLNAAVRLASTSDGSPTDVVVGQVNAAPVSVCLSVERLEGGDRLRRIDLGPIMDGDLVLEGLVGSHVKVLASAHVLLGELTRQTSVVTSDPEVTVEDRGRFNTVNGLGQLRSATQRPDPSNWPPGVTVEIGEAGDDYEEVYRLRSDGTWLRLG